jgi:serine/threonine protein kinase
MLNLKNYYIDEDAPSLYYIMPLYPENLENYLFRIGEDLVPSKVIQIGMDLVKSLRVIHEAGYTYNNVKPHSLMVTEVEDTNMPKVFPIDFTYCQKIGECVEVKEENYGNIVFGSLNYMEDLPVSQKDDLISVCYLIIYCLNLSNLPMLEEHML